MTPKHTIEIYDLPADGDSAIGYRIVSAGRQTDAITDADYLVHSLSETLAHIAVVVRDTDLEQP